MKQIPLTQGKFALVDDEDFKELSKYKWSALKIGNIYYASRHIRHSNGTRGMLSMHRQIMSNPKNIMIDHKNNNGLFNCKCNLRLCTNAQNQHNSRKQINNTSGFKGVSWHKYREKWIAHIRINNKLKHIGYFKSRRDAALAYDRAAKELFGEFAHLNFPELRKI